MVELIITVFQVILAILLIVVVMLQQQGGGLGAAFGGGSSFVNTRRGVDLTLHKATIVISTLFFLTALTLLFV